MQSLLWVRPSLALRAGFLSLAILAIPFALQGAVASASAASTTAAPAANPFAIKPEELTALDRYVAKPDAAYAWKLVSTIPGDGFQVFVLEMTSQSWRKADEVDRTEWKHWLTIVKPTDLASDKALLYINGGNNNDPAPTRAPERDVRIAKETKSIVVNLGMVPNQPLRFSDSKDVGRTEDDLIAYSRVKHFQTQDDEWLVRLAMVKAGVKAMDAVTEFLASPEGGATKVNQYVVSGGSKRAWTAWLVGAVDERVIALIPMVIDALNSEEVTRHGFEAYGFFSPSLGDYVRHGLFPHKIGSPEYRAVLAIEDPYNYRNRARLNIPKFLINASGDQFFLPDNSQFYYKDLPEEKRIRYVENSRHNLADTDAVDSMLAFYQSVITGGKRPSYTWTKAADGTLTARPAEKPKEAKLWQAHNDKTRDFRVDLIGKAYTSTILQPEPDGSYVAHVEKPAQGYTAFFIELTFESGFSVPFNFTTEVSVVPDVLPFRWSDAATVYKDTIDNAKNAAEPRATPAAPAAGAAPAATR